MGYFDDILSLVGIYGKPEAGPQPMPPHTPTPATAYPPKPFAPIPTEGPKLQQYPTSEDAAYARQGGFGYGEPTSAYIEGTAGRIFGDKRGPMRAEGPAPVKLEGIEQLPDLNDLYMRSLKTPTTQQVTPEQRALLQDAHTRAALAVNYSPVAALGYNPRDITADVSGKSVLGQQVAGFTWPDTGQMTFQARSPRTIVHESMHRALAGLKDNPSLPANLRARIEDTTDEESLVRQLMYQQAGNPETSDTAQEQRMAGTQWKPEEIGILNRLAQEAIRQRRPYGGPR